ncbi:YIP1 family protein [Halocatena salina]|uniref:YIP1 family protein n=1 Tax=Halocatena salina TaxID=2934340 RepID=A0A8U0A6X3_9EURY|nr:YIP1 family protein [Halocatena salina]UPM43677.1 YIP1 family protein [Halocatena salina]
MTTWIEASGGRERGVAGLVRAWVGVLVAPHRFFRSAISTGDQAPGLTFAIAVTLLHVVLRIFPSAIQSLSMRMLTLLLVVVFLAPVVLHLCAALETVALIGLVEDRAGVSQTVQVIGYAAAPCALSGVPLTALCVGMAGLCVVSAELIALLWLGAAVYGVVLLVIGTAIVHDTSIPRAVAVTAIPSWIIFGYGFRGIHALELLGASSGLFG